MTIKGIDVSAYQSETYLLSDDGVAFDFVFVKSTEGLGYVNPKYAAQLKRGRDHGLVVGHYVFLDGGPGVRGQIDFFLSKSRILPGEILAVDWENTGVTSAEKDDALKYLKSKKPDHKVLLYCNTDYWTHRDASGYKADGLWVAAYNGKPGDPGIKDAWVLHQFTSTPVIGGVKVGLDESIGNFANRDAFKAWAGVLLPPKPKTVPKPVPVYAPFPGAAFFKAGRKSPLIAAVHKRLVAEGCNKYRSSTGTDVWGSGDVASYAAFQRKLGYSGKSADGVPGKLSWAKLKVPKS